jgi:hypothetical protein
VDPGLVRPFTNAVPLDGGAHGCILRIVSHIKPLYRNAEHVRILPSRQVHRHHEPQPCRRCIPAGLPVMPYGGSVAWGHLRSQPDALPADGRARLDVVRQLSCRRPVRRDADDVLFMPHDRVHQRHQSQSRGRRISDDVRLLSYDDNVDGSPSDTPLSHLFRRACWQMVNLQRLPYKLLELCGVQLHHLSRA